jgi:hypothetical protein
LRVPLEGLVEGVFGGSGTSSKPPTCEAVSE